MALLSLLINKTVFLKKTGAGFLTGPGDTRGRREAERAA
jgi:hypothetical protein